MSDFEVVGGAHGLEADLEDMDATGARIRGFGLDVAGSAAKAHGALLDGNLLQSAVLAPGSFGRFEGALLAALDGPGGLSHNAIRLGASGLVMQGAARAYLATDRASEFLGDVRRHAQGRLFGASLLTNPAGTVAVVATLLAGDGFFADPEGWLVAHPDVLEEVVGSSPGVVDLFLPGVGFPGDVEQASGLLALLYDQSHGKPTTDGPREATGPADLGSALDNLELVAGVPDRFQIQRVGEGKEAVYNVYLPGTKDFDAPWAQSEYVQNLGTNFAGVGRVDNAYVASVLHALGEAGVPAGATINLMGHSQGGIVASRLAEIVTTSPDRELRYDVQTVVTAGSPVDHIELPESVQVISLVNEYDIVPRLDGEAYDDRSNHTTIVTEVQTGDVVENHGLSTVYSAMGHELSASRDRQIRDALAPLENVYKGGDTQTWDFQMHRD